MNTTQGGRERGGKKGKFVLKERKKVFPHRFRGVRERERGLSTKEKGREGGPFNDSSSNWQVFKGALLKSARMGWRGPV